MKLLQTLLLLALASPALAQPTPPAPPAPPAARTLPAPKADKTISLKFEGMLSQALRKIAEAGGINLVVTGNLDQRAEVYLTDVSAEEALGLLARLHNLKVLKQGSIWTVRPMTPAEQSNAGAELSEAQQEAMEAARDAMEEQREAIQEAQEAAREAELEARDAAAEAAEAMAAAAGANGERALEMQQRLQAQIEGRVREKLQRKMNRLGSERDVSGYGRPIVVADGETVKNAVAYGGPLEIYGHVEEDAVSFGGPVKLGPKAYVEGDVVAFGGPIDRDDGAVVEGDEIAFGSAEAGASLARGFKGIRHRSAPDEVEERGLRFELPGFLLLFAVLFGVGFLSMMVAPNKMKQLEAELKKDPVRCGAAGVVGALALLPFSGLLAITVVGLLPMFALWVFLVIAVPAGVSVVAREIGARLPMRNIRKTQAMVLAAGLFILLVVFYIPIIGPFTLVVVGLLSLGAVIRTVLSSRRNGQGIPEPVSPSHV